MRVANGNHFVAVAVVALALAGCNTPGPTVGSGPAQPPFGAAPAPFGAPPAPFGAPAHAAMARPAPILHSSQSQKVTVSADGRTVRTDTTRTNVSFDPDKAAGAAASLFGGGGGSAHGGIPGVWQAQSSSNRSMCSVQLFGAPDASSGAADSTGCDYGGALHGITGWTYANGQMQIKKGGETSITLKQLGPNRFDGKLTWGILTTTIALYR